MTLSINRGIHGANTVPQPLEEAMGASSEPWHLPWCHNEKICEANNWCRKTVGYSLAILLAGAIAALEIWGGHVSGSLALLGDAWHVLSDMVVYAMSMWAVHLKRRDVSSSDIAEIDRRWAIRNSWILSCVVTATGMYAVYRLAHPVHVHSDVMLLVSGLGLAGNVVMYILLRGMHIEHSHGQSGHVHHDHTHKAALLHTLEDMLTSLVVVTAASLIKGFPDTTWIFRLDSTATILICCWINYRAHTLRRNVKEKT